MMFMVELDFQWDHPGMAILSMSTKTQTTGKGIDALIAESRKDGVESADGG